MIRGSRTYGVACKVVELVRVSVMPESIALTVRSLLVDINRILLRHKHVHISQAITTESIRVPTSLA